ncbi:hypothetical protein RTBOTA2_002095 [Rhodotorula toruloides]|nr:hypothetical protein RTBOTA2_002095 [Rhodotorula toruloides]
MAHPRRPIPSARVVREQKSKPRAHSQPVSSSSAVLAGSDLDRSFELDDAREVDSAWSCERGGTSRGRVISLGEASKPVGAVAQAQQELRGPQTLELSHS